MRSDLIRVNSKGNGIPEALALTENEGRKQGLTGRDLLHLRLLAEELFGMLRGIAGEVKADYWLEQEPDRFELHLAARIDLTPEMREQLLTASSTGRNEAAGTFMGKLWVTVVNGLYAVKEGLPAAMSSAASAFPLEGDFAGESAALWSLSAYREEIDRNRKTDGGAVEAWDELERSIVANVADEVKVRIVGKNLEIVLFKSV